MRFNQTMRSRTPALVRAIRHILYVARVARRLRGVVPRECNVCGTRARFHAFGIPPRLDAVCPRCSSLERHRLLKLLLDQRPDLVSGRDVLHFAPELAVTGFIKPLARSLTGADLQPGRADLTLNIESMPAVPAGSYDLVICSHVLEHVDDRLALAEMHRVLRSGGAALLMTPVVEGWRSTYENPAVRTAADRMVHFGQADHVRHYGADIRDRIRAAGFELDEFTAEQPWVLKHGLLRGEKVFIASIL